MSRHRFVRNMHDLEDELYDDDDYYDDENDNDYNEQADEPEVRVQAAQFIDGKLVKDTVDNATAALSRLTLEVRKVVDDSVADREIVLALKKTGNNVSEAINYIFDGDKEDGALWALYFESPGNLESIFTLINPSLEPSSRSAMVIDSPPGLSLSQKIGDNYKGSPPLQARDPLKLSGRLDALLSGRLPKSESEEPKGLKVQENSKILGLQSLLAPNKDRLIGLVPLIQPRLETSSTSDVLKKALTDLSMNNTSSQTPIIFQPRRDSPTSKLKISAPITSNRALSKTPVQNGQFKSDFFTPEWQSSRSLLRAPSSFAHFWTSSLHEDREKTKYSSKFGVSIILGYPTEKRFDMAPFKFNSPSPDDVVMNARSAKDKGHVDAGKSTMMGHLLYLLGEVDERTMRKYEKDSEKMKKGSFAFAWVLDATEEERSRGVTIDVAVSKFETPSRRFTLLDAPGHRDFVPNMISGASQADVALLVIDSTRGEFETGFESGGQTREHSLLVRSLGVTQIVVAINKLDTSNWDQGRFLEIQEKLLIFLVQAGFRRDKITFIPCSGFTGENLIERTSLPLEEWYQGSTLAEALDHLELPPRSLEKPFRLPISDFFKGGLSVGSSATVSLSGRVESGSIQVGDQLMLMPIGEQCTVKAIEILSDPVKWAVAGDNISLSVSGVDITQISVGNILCDAQRPVPVTTHFRAKIVTFDIRIPLTIGVPFDGTRNNFKTDINVESKLRALPKNTTASVEIKLDHPICIETAKESKELGRFMLRLGPTVVAAGIVSDIISRSK
ncbi:HBS1-like protein [Dinochytrium kinnereticum]|nr:HBS1-like protein [Dinochytrium kinnereticum]